jgi:hypothetical protein
LAPLPADGDYPIVFDPGPHRFVDSATINMSTMWPSASTFGRAKATTGCVPATGLPSAAITEISVRIVRLLLEDFAEGLADDAGLQTDGHGLRHGREVTVRAPSRVPRIKDQRPQDLRWRRPGEARHSQGGSMRNS